VLFDGVDGRKGVCTKSTRACVVEIGRGINY
jgi:hypothetical protein